MYTLSKNPKIQIVEKDDQPDNKHNGADGQTDGAGDVGVTSKTAR